MTAERTAFAALERLRTADRLLREATRPRQPLGGGYGDGELAVVFELIEDEPCTELHVVEAVAQARQELRAAAALLGDHDPLHGLTMALEAEVDPTQYNPSKAAEHGRQGVQVLFQSLAGRMRAGSVQPLASDRPPTAQELRAAGLGGWANARHVLIGVGIVVLVPFGLLLPLMCG